MRHIHFYGSHDRLGNYDRLGDSHPRPGLLDQIINTTGSSCSLNRSKRLTRIAEAQVRCVSPANKVIQANKWTANLAIRPVVGKQRYKNKVC